MSYTTESSGAAGSVITAFFDRSQDAESAVERLTSAGVPSSCVHMTAGAGDDRAGSASSSNEEKGFFEMLGDFFFPDEDRHVYAEGLSRGGILVSVRDVRSDLYETVLDVLDDEGAVDVEERAESWRAEGWTGTSAGALPDGVRGTTNDAPYTDPWRNEDPQDRYGSASSGRGESRAEAASFPSGESFGSADRDHRSDETIPLVSEELRVGKREVGHGRVRVRSYVYETPVSEEVELSEEHVEVERRPVDRAISPDDDAFRERSIEAEERREEAVVSREARVTEEVELRRTADTHRETVSDKVRHTEVEVEDDRDDEGRSSR